MGDGFGAIVSATSDAADSCDAVGLGGRAAVDFAGLVAGTSGLVAGVTGAMEFMPAPFGIGLGGGG